MSCHVPCTATAVASLRFCFGRAKTGWITESGQHLTSLENE
jgi:hypothetical protein